VRIRAYGRTDVGPQSLAGRATPMIWFASSWVCTSQERRPTTRSNGGPRSSPTSEAHRISPEDAISTRTRMLGRCPVEVAPDQRCSNLALLARHCAYASPDGTRSGSPRSARVQDVSRRDRAAMRPCRCRHPAADQSPASSPPRAHSQSWSALGTTAAQPEEVRGHRPTCRGKCRCTEVMPVNARPTARILPRPDSTRNCATRATTEASCRESDPTRRSRGQSLLPAVQPVSAAAAQRCRGHPSSDPGDHRQVCPRPMIGNVQPRGAAACWPGQRIQQRLRRSRIRVVTQPPDRPSIEPCLSEPRHARPSAPNEPRIGQRASSWHTQRDTGETGGCHDVLQLAKSSRAGQGTARDGSHESDCCGWFVAVKHSNPVLAASIT